MSGGGRKKNTYRRCRAGEERRIRIEGVGREKKEEYIFGDGTLGDSIQEEGYSILQYSLQCNGKERNFFVGYPPKPRKARYSLV